MRNQSSIQVSIETKHRLKGLKLTQTETYENILLRLLDVKLDGREIDYLIKDNNSRNTLKVKVDWGKTSENILYYHDDDTLDLNLPEPHNDSCKKFYENIKSLDNLINILAVLDENEQINAGEVNLERL